MHGSLNADFAHRERSCQLKCGASGDVYVVTRKFSRLRRSPHDGIALWTGKDKDRIPTRRQIFKRDLPRRISLLEGRKPPPRILQGDAILFGKCFFAGHFEGQLEAAKRFAVGSIQLLRVVNKIEVGRLLKLARVGILHDRGIATWRKTRQLVHAGCHLMHAFCLNKLRRVENVLPQDRRAEIVRPIRSLLGYPKDEVQRWHRIEMHIDLQPIATFHLDRGGLVRFGGTAVKGDGVSDVE